MKDDEKSFDCLEFEEGWYANRKQSSLCIWVHMTNKKFFLNPFSTVKTCVSLYVTYRRSKNNVMVCADFLTVFSKHNKNLFSRYHRES
jgi:hypothetical protein